MMPARASAAASNTAAGHPIRRCIFADLLISQPFNPGLRYPGP
jgi:hypothetical protein